jgi:hypothetical protein
MLTKPQLKIHIEKRNTCYSFVLQIPVMFTSYRWVDAKAFLIIAYNNKKYWLLKLLQFNEKFCLLVTQND